MFFSSVVISVYFGQLGINYSYWLAALRGASLASSASTSGVSSFFVLCRALRSSLEFVFAWRAEVNERERGEARTTSNHLLDYALGHD